MVMMRVILGVLLITHSIHSVQAYNLEMYRRSQVVSNALFATTEKKMTKVGSTDSVTSLIDGASRALSDRYDNAFVVNMHLDILLQFTLYNTKKLLED